MIFLLPDIEKSYWKKEVIVLKLRSLPSRLIRKITGKTPRMSRKWWRKYEKQTSALQTGRMTVKGQEVLTRNQRLQDLQANLPTRGKKPNLTLPLQKVSRVLAELLPRRAEVYQECLVSNGFCQKMIRIHLSENIVEEFLNVCRRTVKNECVWLWILTRTLLYGLFDHNITIIKWIAKYY